MDGWMDAKCNCEMLNAVMLCVVSCVWHCCIADCCEMVAFSLSRIVSRGIFYGGGFFFHSDQ
jgi:hypothetical protein